MTIKLSASSINDFLKCSQMFAYRSSRSEDSIDTEEQAIGKCVHRIIEEDIYFTMDSPLIDYHFEKFNIQDTEKTLRYLNNFTELRPQLVIKETDKKEFYFREKLNKDLQISGLMDRINTEDRIVYDWKASTSTKKYLSNDIQLIIYYSMYKRIFGEYPQVYLVNLHFKELRPFYPNKKYIDTLFNEIIPKIVREVKSKQFYKTGYYTGSCFRCPFIGVCGTEDM